MECSFFHTKPIFRPITIIRRRTIRSQYGGFNTPSGKLLSGLLMDDRQSFQVAARTELDKLALQRNQAMARLNLSIGSPEASLHKRIAELKTLECQESVEDIMYMLILQKFSEIGVHMIPNLSKCAYNGRVEIWPSKHWELESIHTSEVLEMVRAHLSAFIGSRAYSNVTASWEIANIKPRHLSRLYTFSIDYGYLLKSVSFRHSLECGLELSNSPPLSIGTAFTKIPVLETSSLGSKLGFGQTSWSRSMFMGQPTCGLETKREDLKGYVKGLDQEMIQMFAKPESKESLDLIERHISALFGDNNSGLAENDEKLICTSVTSMKRFMLEAIAFGSFLWETEKFVYSSYMLEGN